MMTALFAVPLILSLLGDSWTDAVGKGAAMQLPSDAQCGKLPRTRSLPFSSGEVLELDIDVMTARAGKMYLTVLPMAGKGATAEIPIRGRVKTSNVFAKVRRVRSEVTSYLRLRDLHPRRYREDTMENEVNKVADVAFGPRSEKVVSVDWAMDAEKGSFTYPLSVDSLDLLGAIYYFRAAELSPGVEICFDAYAIRRMWRIWGKVAGREKVTTPLGTTEALHIAGIAARKDDPSQWRELHLWISDDRRHLPLVAMGGIDLGPVRATLVRVGRMVGRGSRGAGEE